MGDSYGANLNKVSVADERKGRGKSGRFSVIIYLVTENEKTNEI
jgi:hypothetical protein